MDTFPIVVYVAGPRGHARASLPSDQPVVVCSAADSGAPAPELPELWDGLLERLEWLRERAYGSDVPEPLRVLVAGQAGGREAAMAALEIFVSADGLTLSSRHGAPVSTLDVLRSVEHPVLRESSLVWVPPTGELGLDVINKAGKWLAKQGASPSAGPFAFDESFREIFGRWPCPLESQVLFAAIGRHEADD